VRDTCHVVTWFNAEAYVRKAPEDDLSNVPVCGHCLNQTGIFVGNQPRRDEPAAPQMSWFSQGINRAGDGSPRFWFHEIRGVSSAPPLATQTSAPAESSRR
jgi:hypothetical protein